MKTFHEDCLFFKQQIDLHTLVGTNVLINLNKLLCVQIAAGMSENIAEPTNDSEMEISRAYF